MTNLVKLTVIFLVLFSLVLSGCAASAEKTRRYVTPGYTVTIDGNVCSLWCDQADRTVNQGNNMAVVIHPVFSSIGEMRQAIITGDITEEELYAVMRTAKKNEDGSVQICNVDQLYECDIPSDIEVKYISWSGSEYTYSISSATAWGGITCVASEAYYDRLDREYTNYADNYTVTVTSQENVEDRSATVNYYTTAYGKFKQICYEIRSGNKSIIVQEDYVLETDISSSEVSATIPRQINLWIADGSGYAYGIFFGFAERPSVEWLSQFGLREYVETEVA